jgi:5-methylcytosine-specific restriction enzyme A
MQKLPPHPNQKFYDSPRWKRLRLACRRRDHFRCVVCGASVARPGQARSDHIKSIATHPHLALDPKNVRTLCVVCDGRSHREKGRRLGAPREERFAGCDAEGWPFGS